MAGNGQRFKDAGYKEDKAFIDVLGKPMFQAAIENLNIEGDYFFIVRPEHEERVWDVTSSFMYPNRRRVCIANENDKGAAAACLRIEPRLQPDEPLIITNCDQIIDWNSEDFLHYCVDTRCDGCVPTFKADSPTHSYAATNSAPLDHLVKVIAEKVVISDNALCGVHYWRSTEMAMCSFAASLRYKPHYNGDYYIAPTYNELIKLGNRILIYPTKGMTILGTPDKLKEYIENSSTS